MSLPICFTRFNKSICYHNPPCGQPLRCLANIRVGVNERRFALRAHQGILVPDRTAFIVMTSSNGNILLVTGPLCREFTDHRGQWRGALMFSSICAWVKSWVNNRETGDLRRQIAHYGVTVMYRKVSFISMSFDHRYTIVTTCISCYNDGSIPNRHVYITWQNLS